MASRTPPVIALVNAASQMGGVEFSTLYLAQRLLIDRFHCIVICPAEGDLPQHCRELNIPVEIVPRPRLYSTSLRLFSRSIINPFAWLMNIFVFLIAARHLAQRLRQLKVDLVCTKSMFTHFYGGLAARWAQVPCVWHVQDLVSERARGIYRSILSRVARRLADRVIVDGAPIARQLRSAYPSDRIAVIHNGVDTDQFSPQVDGRAVRQGWNVIDSEILIGNIARLVFWKGQLDLIRAFASIATEFDQAKLVLVGSPVFGTVAYEQELQQLVRQLHLTQRVIFAGYRWDLPQVLAAIDVYVQASIEKDTSPLSVVSAMAAGKPIVATNVAGVAELFEPDHDGLLVEVSNVTALAAGLRKLLSDAQLRQSLGQAARVSAEKNLSLPEFARRCEAVFEQALNAVTV